MHLTKLVWVGADPSPFSSGSFETGITSVLYFNLAHHTFSLSLSLSLSISLFLSFPHFFVRICFVVAEMKEREREREREKSRFDCLCDLLCLTGPLSLLSCFNFYFISFSLSSFSLPFHIRCMFLCQTNFLGDRIKGLKLRRIYAYCGCRSTRGKKKVSCVLQVVYCGDATFKYIAAALHKPQVVKVVSHVLRLVYCGAAVHKMLQRCSLPWWVELACRSAAIGALFIPFSAATLVISCSL